MEVNVCFVSNQGIEMGLHYSYHDSFLKHVIRTAFSLQLTFMALSLFPAILWRFSQAPTLSNIFPVDPVSNQTLKAPLFFSSVFAWQTYVRSVLCRNLKSKINHVFNFSKINFIITFIFYKLNKLIVSFFYK